jgi:two-component system LytT family response regulator
MRNTETTFTQATGMVVLKTADGNIFRKLQEIVRFEANGKYTLVYNLNGKSPERVIGCITDIEIKLNGNNCFFRCHRSHIINVLHIKKYIKKTGSLVSESGVVPISITFVKEFEERYCV